MWSGTLVPKKKNNPKNTPFWAFFGVFLAHSGQPGGLAPHIRPAITKCGWVWAMLRQWFGLCYNGSSTHPNYTQSGHIWVVQRVIRAQSPTHPSIQPILGLFLAQSGHNPHPTTESSTLIHSQPVFWQVWRQMSKAKPPAQVHWIW